MTYTFWGPYNICYECLYLMWFCHDTLVIFKDLPAYCIFRSKSEHHKAERQSPPSCRSKTSKTSNIHVQPCWWSCSWCTITFLICLVMFNMFRHFSYILSCTFIGKMVFEMIWNLIKKKKLFSSKRMFIYVVLYFWILFFINMFSKFIYIIILTFRTI